MDGSGDGENATVWKYSNGKYEKLYGTSIRFRSILDMQLLF